MINVCFIVEYVEHYNVSTFISLKQKLLKDKIDLKVLYNKKGQVKDELNILDNSIFVKIPYINVKMFIQILPFIKYRSDIYVIKQGEKYLLSYLLMLFAPIFNYKLCVWGNCKKEYPLFKNGDKSWKNRIWWRLAKNVDVWFVYNEYVKYIINDIYDNELVCSVNNTIDVDEERLLSKEVKNKDILKVKNDLDINEDDKVCLYCGRIYKEKRIEFLLEALKKIKKRDGKFKFIMIGDGEERAQIIKFQEKNYDWFKWVGPKYKKEKILYFKISQLQLMPGLVGLHIIDSFVHGLPIVTTDNNYHSVEIEYMKNWYNGVMVCDDIDIYVDAVYKILNNKEIVNSLKNGCIQSVSEYSIQKKINGFYEGLKKVSRSNL